VKKAINKRKTEVKKRTMDRGRKSLPGRKEGWTPHQIIRIKDEIENK